MNKLKELRISHELTQDDLAREFEEDPRRIDQYERERSQMPSSFLLRAAKRFGVTTRYLSGLPEVEPPAGTQDIQRVTRVLEVYHQDDVNLLLGEGWKLLHVGDDTERHPDGSGHANVAYALGWFGAPQDARDAVPHDGGRIWAN